MNGEIVIQDGKKYLIIGNKAIPFDAVDANGKPIIKTNSETIKYPDGRQDVTVFVDCLDVNSEVKQPKI